jgi:tetratricopeptide (TPR) repeat protein
MSTYRRITATLLLVTLAGCPATSRQLPDDPTEALKRDIAKAKFAIRKTKVLIAKAGEADYVPDLYLRLAELYVERARYHYHLDAGERPSREGVKSIPAQVLKTSAISTYRRLLQLFPGYRDADKVRFFMAHELRELGEFERMAEAYRELAEKHPQSPYRAEGLLILGDHHFQKGELGLAERSFRQVIAMRGPAKQALAGAQATARYKLAWCRINRADFKQALELLEGSAEAARKWLARYRGRPAGLARPGGGHPRVDLAREALVDAVYPYTEVRPAKDALTYFKRRARDKSAYLAALDKLGNRYYIKADWSAAAMVYRELLALSGESEDAVERARRLYEAVTNGRLEASAAGDVAAIIDVVRRRRHDADLSPGGRKELLQTFEKITRDIATKLHALAVKRKQERLFNAAAAAYSAYLSLYGDAAQAAAVRANLAGAFFAARRHLEAGITFELASMTQQGEQLKTSIYSAAASYYEFLRSKPRRRIEVVRARAGLRRVGRRFIKRYPKDPRVVQVKFNIARTFHAAGQFDEGIRLFTALVEQYPKSKEAVAAAHLVLTAYRTLDDDAGVLSAGGTFAAMARLGDAAFKKDLALIVEGAKDRILGKLTVEGRLSDLIGTDLECKALTNQVAEAQARKQTLRLLERGDKLAARCPSDRQLPRTLAVMGRAAVGALQLRRGVLYLELAARRHAGANAASLYLDAGELRAALGQRRKADRDLTAMVGLPHTTKAKAALALRVAQLHLGARDWPAAIATLQRAAALGATSTVTQATLAYALLRQGELEAAGKTAAPVATASLPGRSAGSALAAAAALARYVLGEAAFRAGFGAPLQVRSMAQLNNALTRLLGAVGQARQALTTVVATGDAGWSVAALGRLGAMDARAARDLRALPLPAGLSPEQVRKLRAAIERHAAPLAREASQMIKQCAATAARLRVLSPAARACSEGRAPAELVALGTPPAPRSAARGPVGIDRLLQTLARRPSAAGAAKLAARYLEAGRLHLSRVVAARGLTSGGSADLHNLLGVAQHRLQSHQAGLAQLDLALKQNPRHRYARINRAALLARFGQTKAARADAREVRGARPEASDPRLIPGALKALELLR